MDAKSWQPPKLKTYGSVEAFTQSQLNDLGKAVQFMVPFSDTGLLASLEI